MGGLTGPPTSPDRLGDPLGLSAERFRELAHQLVDRVADHWAEVDQQPVIQQADRESLAALSGPVPQEPGEIEELIELLAEHALANIAERQPPTLLRAGAKPRKPERDPR